MAGVHVLCCCHCFFNISREALCHDCIITPKSLGLINHTLRTVGVVLVVKAAHSAANDCCIVNSHIAGDGVGHIGYSSTDLNRIAAKVNTGNLAVFIAIIVAENKDACVLGFL